MVLQKIVSKSYCCNWLIMQEVRDSNVKTFMRDYNMFSIKFNSGRKESE